MSKSFDKSLFVLLFMYVVQTGIFIFNGFASPLSVIATYMGITCVYLIAKNNPFNFVLGAISSAVFGYYAFQGGMNADAILQTGYIIFDIIGLYLVFTGARKSHKLTDLTTKQLAIVSAVAIGLFLIFFSTISNGWLDAAVGALGLVSMYFTAINYKNTFYAWVAMNFLQTAMWLVHFSQGNQVGLDLGVMYSMYLINSLFGLYSWSKAKKAQEERV
ncbi:nicotinamide mononucleotide transporter [Vagococcus coleopterorum]|uniref:Nicotinamide mononucleotide transporter n=1 Tax=Vagococcus coleopterorum TaxID=2714946 RepID=A0A6G8ANQ7_9ENTE|nr:nicotinamide riboside transporter PnuC [Vagococcus coleopterorum]QIL46627.1 nicotinamide mononucleotide transporter [Vagococcus coleopterorum]